MVTTILITVLSLLRLSQSLTLTTGFNRDNSYWGNMFDVQNRENYLQIDGFDLNLFDGTWDIEIWYKKCSYFGFHDDASAWTEIHTETVTSSGINSPTSLTPLTTPINMYPHTTYSFWIAVVSGGTVPDEYDGAMMYTDGNEECDLWICDANLQFYQGLGTNKIPNDFWKPRVWNGNIYYTIVPPFNPPNTDPCTNECTTTASIAICTVTNAPTISTNTPTILTNTPTILTNTPTILTNTPTILTNTPTTPPTILTNAPTILTNTPTILTNTPTIQTNIPTTPPTDSSDDDSSDDSENYN